MKTAFGFRIQRICRILSGIALLILPACETSKTPILPMSPEVSPDSPELAPQNMAHPEYANWIQFPVGAKVIRHRVVTNEGGEVKEISTLTLTDKGPKNLEVTTQVTVERTGEPAKENPPEISRFPDAFSIPSGLSEDFFTLPNLKAKKVEVKEQEVHGKTVRVDVYQWTESNETGPMTVTLWRSDQVPGRVVRQEMLIESSQTKAIEELILVKWD